MNERTDLEMAESELLQRPAEAEEAAEFLLLLLAPEAAVEGEEEVEKLPRISTGR